MDDLKVEILESGDVKITSDKLSKGATSVIIDPLDFIKMINELLDKMTFSNERRHF